MKNTLSTIAAVLSVVVFVVFVSAYEPDYPNPDKKYGANRMTGFRCINGVTYIAEPYRLTPLFNQDSKVVTCDE